MLTREFSVDAVPCQRRVALQRVAAGVLLPTWATWATGAQAQMGLSGAINYAGWFRALSQRMAKAYCQQYLQVLPAAAVDVMGLARKMVQTGSGELARGMQSGQWPAEVGRQLAEVQKQFALLNQFTRVTHQRICTVIVGECKKAAAVFHDALQLQRLFQSPSHWFIADHIYAGF